jgi:3-hydroxyisobutyrate dehydrogenase-like beta-hydroxyacid dehydrogenase
LNASSDARGGLKVAFVGIGRMGLPMAGNVLRGGHDLTVFNRTASRCDPLRDEGAAVATTPAEAVRGAEVLVTMLADPAAVEDLLEGEDGVLSNAPENLVWLEMSTIGPTAARRFADRAADAGVEMLDAPVSGSIAVAEAAALVSMVGGNEAGLKLARPVLETMTEKHFHLGSSGAGAAMKLGLNVMIAAHTVAISEALVMAEDAGIDRVAAYEVIAAGVVGSPFVDYKRDAFIDPDGTPPAFALDLMRKDLRLALQQGEMAGAPLFGTTASAEAMTVAAGLEGGEADLVKVADALRRIAAGPKN